MLLQDSYCGVGIGREGVSAKDKMLRKLLQAVAWIEVVADAITIRGGLSESFIRAKILAACASLERKGQRPRELPRTLSVFALLPNRYTARKPVVLITLGFLFLKYWFRFSQNPDA